MKILSLHTAKSGEIKTHRNPSAQKGQRLSTVSDGADNEGSALKYRIFLLAVFFTLPFFSFSQCPDDFWSNAVLVRDNDLPVEIQVGPGVAFKGAIIERKDTTKTETWVIMKKGTAVPVPPIALKETIDNTSPRNVYSGTWTTAHRAAGTNTPTAIYNAGWAANFLNENCVFTTAVGSTLTFQFSGKKIEWYAEKRSNHQNVSIEVDGVMVTLNLHASTDANGSQMVHEKTLPQGNHTIKITNTGTSVVHDYFKIYE